jgi:hypothetical protein
MTMSDDPYKAWLDSMPIDDVRRRIERLEQKLMDLRVLERIYGERHHGESESAHQEPQAGGEWQS